MGFEEFEDDSDAEKKFHKFTREINENCGIVKSQDRCDNAFEFMKCFDAHFVSFEDRSLFYDDSSFDSNEKDFKIEESEMKVSSTKYLFNSLRRK